jgi:hypothetical protein
MYVATYVMFMFQKIENSVNKDINSMYRNSVVGKPVVKVRVCEPTAKMKG